MYEKPEIEELGTLTEMTEKDKTLGHSDGTTLSIPGVVPPGTPIGFS